MQSPRTCIGCKKYSQEMEKRQEKSRRPRFTFGQATETHDKDVNFQMSRNVEIT